MAFYFTVSILVNGYPTISYKTSYTKFCNQVSNGSESGQKHQEISASVMQFQVLGFLVLSHKNMGYLWVFSYIISDIFEDTHEVGS